MSQDEIEIKERVLNKIEKCLLFFQNSLLFGPRPTLHVAGLDESCPIEAGKHSIHKFTCTLVVLRDIYKLLLAGSHRTKRAIFYDHKQLFGECAVLDQTLRLICQLLQEPRIKLNILSSSKGVIMGDLMFRSKDGVASDCNIAPTQVPPVVDDIIEVISNAKFILIVEKETIFQRLLDEEFCSQFYPSIMITAKGYPDYATRQMLQLLLNSLRIPMYVLVDGDPYGIDIYLTYRFGSSINNCDVNVNNINLDCIRWLGVLPSEISRLNFPSDQYLALTDREKSKLRCMWDRASDFDDERILVDELQIMLELGLKVELEALCSLGASYLSQVYLRSKLAYLFETAFVSPSQ